MKKDYLELHPKLKEVLETIVLELHNTLRSKLAGVYLQGSLAIGDFDSSSDVDFIVVVKEELSEQEVKAWQIKHLEIHGQDNRWVKRLEYSFFPVSILRKLSSPYPKQGDRDLLWYFDNGSQTIERLDHCNSIVVRWTVRENGIVLYGPSAKTFIDPIPKRALQSEIQNTLIGWGEELLENPNPYRNRFYQSYLVLNYSRMLHDLYNGQISSKLSGINWAKSYVSEKWKDHIDFCWKERLDPTISDNQPADSRKFKRTMEYVEYVIQETILYDIPN